jgi:hypothetical protein
VREQTASTDKAAPKCTLLRLFAELPLRGFRLAASGVARAPHLIELLPESISRPLDESLDVSFKGRGIGPCVAPPCNAASAEFFNGRINAVKRGNLDSPFAELIFAAGDLATFDCAQDHRPVQTSGLCGRCQRVVHAFPIRAR